ncbi:hypothetical protein FQA47_016088 [Oryzias melastigma]|uniref:Uncharacterized protein n=1 Tax=Oryzias melastigma TaxID=30732 RepID=A0A834L0Q4_ORYME|nr:hypothetical protein FQA47_016088 [Oryzias melastigma]
MFVGCVGGWGRRGSAWMAQAAPKLAIWRPKKPHAGPLSTAGAITEVGEPDVIVNVPPRPTNRSAEEAMEGPVQANVPAASPWVPLCHAAIWPCSSPQ